MTQIIQRLLALCGLHLTSVHALPLNKVTVRMTVGFSELLGLVQNVPGDVVECGVGNGRSFAVLAFLVQTKDRMLWGFDSFGGFPEPSVEDTSARNPKKGEWGHANERAVLKTLEVSNINRRWQTSNVRLVKGFFAESLSKYTGKQIALLHVDADLYQSYKDVFSALYAKMAKGGVITFDEYGMEKWPGATKAIDGFLAETGLKLQHQADMDRYFVQV